MEVEELEKQLKEAEEKAKAEAEARAKAEEEKARAEKERDEANAIIRQKETEDKKPVDLDDLIKQEFIGGSN